MDSGHQADKAWLLGVQTKLYQWSRKNPAEKYRELWNWVIDPRNLRCAWRVVASNKGKRTPGIDGETVGGIRRRMGEMAFVEGLRLGLRSRSYRPKACRRKFIPKRGAPGKFRPLGIPTITDRVVQCAVKQILEPIFEAQFWHVSYGFRPGRGCHGALEHIRMAMRPRAKAADGKRHSAPYQWVIEGDIKGCFDNIDHHALMERVRRRIGDRKVCRLLTQFLKAGVLDEAQLVRSPTGTPQGGVISPLLANVALTAIEERYERWVHHQKKTRACRKSDGIQAAIRARATDRRLGRPVFFPVRYADDFVVLISGSHEAALAEKKSLAAHLQDTMRLELSAEKTRVTPLTEGFEFLGHRVRLRWDQRFGFTPRIEIPKMRAADLRHRVKQLTVNRRANLPLSRQLQDLNPILRGWAYFYRYCTNAKTVLSHLDWYVDDRLWRWMRKKYPKASARQIARHRSRRPPSRRKVWRDGKHEQFIMSTLPVMRFRRGWMGTPDYASTLGEPDA